MTRDKLLHILETEMHVESNIINKKIGTDNEMGTLQDNGRLGRLQGIHWVWRLIKQLDKAIEIPNNPTNGDMIMAMFPNGDLHDYDYYDGYVIYEINYVDCKFDKDWWNAPYKTESEEKK